MTDRRHPAYPPQNGLTYPPSQWNGTNQPPSQYPSSVDRYHPSSYDSSTTGQHISTAQNHPPSMFGTANAQSSGMPYQGEYYPVAPYIQSGNRSSSTSIPQQSLYPSVNQTYSITQSSRPSHTNSHSRSHSHIQPYPPPQPSRQPPAIAPHHPVYPQQLSFSQPVTSTQYPASPSRPFSCDMCALSFNRQHDLKRHRETHTGEKPYLCNCGKTFTRKDALKRHQLVKQCGNDDDA